MAVAAIKYTAAAVHVLCLQAFTVIALKAFDGVAHAVLRFGFATLHRVDSLVAASKQQKSKRRL